MNRRAWLSTLALGAAGCDAMKPKMGFLGRMEKFNASVESALFRGNSGTPTYSLADETPMARWPSYFVAPNMPMMPPGWILRVGGLVERPTMLTVADLQRMTRTD